MNSERKKYRKPAGPTGKMPNSLLKSKRPWQLAIKEDEREGQTLLHR